jgi:DNA ligase-1
VWLVDECYSTVGDLSETISLLVPYRTNPPDGAVVAAASPSLRDIIENRLKPLPRMSPEQRRATIEGAWRELDPDERLVFHKLMRGSFRVGVSKQMLVKALAAVAGVAPAVIAHRLAGDWKPTPNSMKALIAGGDSPGRDSNGHGGDGDTGVADAPSSPIGAGLPYPFMLAHALSAEPASLGSIDDWLIERKWDGIRAQVIRRNGRTAIWSRGDELITGAFPEISSAAASLNDSTTNDASETGEARRIDAADGIVLDGEIVAWDDARNRPLPFTDLQHRLNRGTVELSFWPDVIVSFIAFDLVEVDGNDLRGRPLRERREILQRRLAPAKLLPAIRASTPVECGTWDGLAACVAESRKLGVEGVMLKRRDSAYVAGRPTGLWWKLKIAPMTADVVMIGAQAGNGKRAGLLTDYTFGVWDGDTLVPVAKAYSGLTNAEITEVDRFVRNHTIARHGPVYVVEPTLVFELGFEAIQKSSRHKSGIALRFPRILRQRTDKKPADADRIETMRELLIRYEARQ